MLEFYTRLNIAFDTQNSSIRATKYEMGVFTKEELELAMYEGGASKAK